MKKVLITYQIPREGLQELMKKFDVTYPENETYTQEELLSMVPDYDAILVVRNNIDAGIINAAKNLKIISVFGAGYDNVDVNYATSKGIVVTNIPDVMTEPTAEHVFALMLSLMRRISELDRKLRADKNYKWGIMNNLASGLFGKKLGIIGMGKIGKSVARRALAFGMDVYYFNRNRLSVETEKSLGVNYLPFEDILKESDVLSLHVPLSAATHHLIGNKELSLLKPSAYIINAARGPIIDEQALVEYLKEDKIAGAGLDVFENEPIINGELLKLDNVIMTPHTGTQTIECRIEGAKESSRNIIDFFEGITPHNIVNKEVLNNVKK